MIITLKYESNEIDIYSICCKRWCTIIMQIFVQVYFRFVWNYIVSFNVWKRKWRVNLLSILTALDEIRTMLAVTIAKNLYFLNRCILWAIWKIFLFQHNTIFFFSPNVLQVWLSSKVKPNQRWSQIIILFNKYSYNIICIWLMLIIS